MNEGKKSFYQWQRPDDTYRSMDGNGDCLNDCGCDECMSERFAVIGVAYDERKRFYDGSGYPLQHGELTFLSSNGLYIKTIRLNKDGALDNKLDLFNAPPEAEFLLVKDSKGIVLMQYALSA